MVSLTSKFIPWLLMFLAWIRVWLRINMPTKTKHADGLILSEYDSSNFIGLIHQHSVPLKLSLAEKSGKSRQKKEISLQGKEVYPKNHNRTEKFLRLPVSAKEWNLVPGFGTSRWSRRIEIWWEIIDVFSRLTYSQDMWELNLWKVKTEEQAKQVFLECVPVTKHISSSLKKLWTDRGKEIQGEFRRFCDDVGVKVYHTFSDTKASFAERAIRSLKILYRLIEE